MRLSRKHGKFISIILCLYLHPKTSLCELNWDSSKCSKIFQEETEIQGTGCVSPGSIPSVEKACPRCAFNYQCESDWCHREWKMCYDPEVGGCATGKAARCKNCPSERGVDFSKCDCENSDFPNTWVNCTDGSDAIDKYKTKSFKGYSRKENGDGSLKSKDQFAQNAMCYHNKFRETIGLGALEWNTELALFAKEWVDHLKVNEQCKSIHSKNRTGLAGFFSAGENLFRKSMPDVVTANEIPPFAASSSTAWYAELINYQYAGPDSGAGVCPYRNTDLKANPQVLHMTQVLWHDTTDIGCDYAICDPNDKGTSYVVVSCVYGPAGNVAGQAPFNDTVYCNLNNDEGVVEKFGNIPRCDGKTVDCANVDSWTTAPPAVETTKAVSLESDALCTTDKGRTCKFPWTKAGYGTFESCQDAVNRRGKPICFTLEEKWDKCPSDSLDPDCYFELP